MKCLIFAAATALCLAGVVTSAWAEVRSVCQISRADVDKLRGMHGAHLQEVEALIGCAGKLESAERIGEWTVKNIEWEGNGGFGVAAELIFVNDIYVGGSASGWLK